MVNCLYINFFANCFRLCRGSHLDVAKISVESKVERVSENAGGVQVINSSDKDLSGAQLL